jgi:VCBS repeat-containing protein
MPAVSSVSTTGNAYLDAMFMGVKWATGSLTFSFPDDPSYYGAGYPNGEPANNFEAFTALQQTQTRKALAIFSSVTNLTFTEVTETATVHGDLRFAESDATATAWGYYPTTHAAGGDMWFNNSKNYYDNPLTGTYGFLTIMHETGHAMGLKHPHGASGSFGAMPADRDSLEYSVMSYRSYIGGPMTGYTNGPTSYPQTLMMYDIAALQTLYGANYAHNGGDTVYRWNPATGEMSLNGVGQGAPAGNKIFMTIWDGGGNDTYDFSNYTTAMTVRLAPGEWSTVSSVQLASLGGGYYAAGNIANALLHQNNTASLIENAIGGSAADTLIGNALGNSLTGKGGNDTLDGGAGTDTAVYSGLQANYTLTQNGDGSWTIADLRTGTPDGTDTLKNMEIVKFADTSLTLGSYTPPANSAPVMTSVAPTATLTEWTDNSAAEAANTAHTASGSLTYTDADALDAHTATFAARAAGYLGAFTLNTAAIDSADTVGWSYSVSGSALDYLAAGQTLTQYYDVTLGDGKGGTAMQTVTVRLAGANDGVVMTSVAPTAALTEWTDNSAAEAANTAHTASGSLTYTDADALDAHTATFAARGAGYLGTFTLNTAAIDSADTVGWSYSVSDSAMDYLAAGQSLTQYYDVTLGDGKGGTAMQTVTVTLTGTGDAVTVNAVPVMTSVAPTAALTEWADNSTAEAANTPHTASGSLTYTDADALDTHTATFAAKASGYLGTFTLNTAAIDTNDTVGWSYSVSGSALDYLAAGQSLTQYYDVTLSDGKGGTAKQTVTVTLAGANDGVVMTSAAPAVSLTEWADKSAAEAANTAHTASGSLTYTDADVLDTHTATFAAKAAGYLGTFTLNTAAIDSGDMIGWSFSVSDSAIDHLAAGQTLKQYYDVTVSDGKGGTAMQTVTVDLVGTADGVNSAPVANNDSYSTGKNQKLMVSKSTGILANDQDPDGGHISAVLVSRPKYGTLSFNSDGSFSYRPNKNVVATDSFTYKDWDGTAYSNVATVVIGVGSAAPPAATTGPVASHSDGHSIFEDQIPSPFGAPANPGLLGIQGMIQTHLGQMTGG